MNLKPKNYFRSLAILAVGILIPLGSLAANALGDDIKKQLALLIFHDATKTAQVVPYLFYFVVGAITLAAIVFYQEHKQATQEAQQANLEPQLFASEEDQKTRAQLIKRIENAWINDALRQRVSPKLDISVKLLDSPSSALTHAALVPDDTTHPEANRETFFSAETAFAKYPGSLLVLGEPGAGKTIVLLQFADVLLKHANTDSAASIPIVVNLSSWGTTSQKLDGTLQSWLAAEISTFYKLNQKIAREWIDRRAFVLLLDGLDEVRSQFRNDCIESINKVLAESQLDLIITCRTGAYAETEKLSVDGAVSIESLTSEEVTTALESAGTELAAFTAVVKADLAWQAFLNTPLNLDIAVRTYEGTTEAIPPLFGQQKLWDAYVARMVKRTKDSPLKSETINLIQQVATLMNLANTPYFAPDVISFSELGMLRAAEFTHLLATLSITLASAITFHFGFPDGPYFVAGCTSLVFILSYQIDPSALTDRVTFSFSSYMKGLKNPTLWIIVFILALLSATIIRNRVFLIPIALVSTIGFGLEAPMFSGSDKPYDGIWRNCLACLTLLGAYIPFTLLALYVTHFWVARTHDASFFGILFLICCISSFAAGGGGKLFEWLMLRAWLKLTGALPLRLYKPLTYAEKMLLIDRLGGKWTFRHIGLRDYCATNEIKV